MVEVGERAFGCHCISRLPRQSVVQKHGSFNRLSEVFRSKPFR
jgi:hypothetical protein